MKRVAIMGLGLMGGSLGLALRQIPGISVRGYARRRETRDAAHRMNAVEELFEYPSDAVRDAEIVVFCVPVLAIPELARACSAALPAGCILTDVGSTKAELAHEMEPILANSGARYVGSHPLAGSESSGIEAARSDLYRNAMVIVASDKASSKEAGAVVDFWKMVGSRVVTMTPKMHDQIVARTSHLPHLVAAALVRHLEKGKQEDLTPFCATGFRDTTRIAAGPEDVWHDIVKSNRDAVAHELQEFRKVLSELSDLIEAEDFTAIREFLADARGKRRALDER